MYFCSVPTMHPSDCNLGSLCNYALGETHDKQIPASNRHDGLFSSQDTKSAFLRYYHHECG